MKTARFDYELPSELIAQEPLDPRDSSRLMVINRQVSSIEHGCFTDVVDYLDPGDCLVINDTRVIPARLKGKKKGSGGKVEILLLNERMDCCHEEGRDGVSFHMSCWESLVKPGKRLPKGTQIIFDTDSVEAVVGERIADGKRIIHFKHIGSFEKLIEKIGEVPLPPYINKPLSDSERYQTIYARKNGSIAAPTAGLHFTSELMSRIKKKGVDITSISLVVGIGTFQPVRTANIEDHQVHKELYEISDSSAIRINKAKERGGRVVAAGTTTVRALESAAFSKSHVVSKSKETDLSIYPGHNFKVVDRLITNFHLPRSSLLMLVCAFAETEFIMKSYREAVEQQYRFFSFGDAMLIM